MAAQGRPLHRDFGAECQHSADEHRGSQIECQTEPRPPTGHTGLVNSSAEAVALGLGIRQFGAEVLPGDKAAVVQELRSAG